MLPHPSQHRCVFPKCNLLRVGINFDSAEWWAEDRKGRLRSPPPTSWYREGGQQGTAGAWRVISVSLPVPVLLLLEPRSLAQPSLLPHDILTHPAPLSQILGHTICLTSPCSRDLAPECPSPCLGVGVGYAKTRSWAGGLPTPRPPFSSFLFLLSCWAANGPFLLLWPLRLPDHRNQTKREEL